MNMKKLILLISLLNSLVIFGQDINSPAPDFSGKDINNNTIKLSDFKNKVILLDFWASWCVPCKKSIPYLIDYFSSNKDTNFVIIAVNVDTDMDNFKSFKNKLEKDFPFIVVLDPNNKIIKQYNIEAMPTTIFINKKGIIKKIFTGFTDDSKKEYSNEIENLLKENNE